MNTKLTLLLFLALPLSSPQPQPADMVDASSSPNPISTFTYDQAHIHLDSTMGKISAHSENLDRGAYIGFQYATGQLYSYLLAIHYKDKDILDVNYKYKYNAPSFEDLIAAYHENVDFASIQLTQLKHVENTIEIEFRYTNKKTKRAAFLHYLLDYGVHGLTDKSVFPNH
ncbi:hypothetical protein [Brevibacillus reuszeri]|uniref:hypothetical protein n=1 Tax=Brevibacillus reuszeri TaxID=54915 RepID=UPI00289B2F60|nr:hypothetical protein [Brevibacillus reuszeri]